MRLNKAMVFVAFLVPVTALASWHASRHGQPASAMAESEVPPEPGWVPPIDSRRWRCLVIHHSATETGGAERFARAHRDRGWDDLGYHFVVGNGSATADGRVEVGPRWAQQKHGAHCWTPDEFYNIHGIGICLVGNLDHHPPTARQRQSLDRLVRFLCRRYHIPADHVYTHGGLTGKTRCPGARFDLEEVREAVGR